MLSVGFVRPGVSFPKEVLTIELTKITGGSPVVPNSLEYTDEKEKLLFSTLRVRVRIHRHLRQWRGH